MTCAECAAHFSVTPGVIYAIVKLAKKMGLVISKRGRKDGGLYPAPPLR